MVLSAIQWQEDTSAAMINTAHKHFICLSEHVHILLVDRGGITGFEMFPVDEDFELDQLDPNVDCFEITSPEPWKPAKHCVNEVPMLNPSTLRIEILDDSVKDTPKLAIPPSIDTVPSPEDNVDIQGSNVKIPVQSPS